MRTGLVIAATAALAAIACGARPAGPVAPACDAYFRCVDAVSPDFGARNSDYAEGGRCWTTTSDVAASCVDTCVRAHSNLRALRPDAGC